MASMTRDQIAFIVTALGGILAVLKEAGPADKAEIYAGDGVVPARPIAVLAR
jgi:hypothetical protein